MKVEGYQLTPCGCTHDLHKKYISLSIGEYFDGGDQGKFFVECQFCGETSSLERSKEAAVHSWNKNHNLLLG